MESALSAKTIKIFKKRKGAIPRKSFDLDN